MTVKPNTTPTPCSEESPIPEPILASQFFDIWHRKTLLPPERQGAKSGLTEEFFTIAHLIESGH